MQHETEDLLDAYINGTMTANTRTQFEASLSADETLRNELELHRQTTEIIGIAALKAAMGRIQQTTILAAEPAAQKKGIVRSFYNTRWMQAAAAVLLLGVGLTTWKLASRGGAGDALYSKYYTQDAGLPGMMGATATYSLDDAMVDYKSAAYPDAITKLSALQQQHVAGDTAAFYLGMSYLGNKDFIAAEKTLQPLTKKENPFRQKATWYDALANLKLDKKSDAKPELETVAADANNPKAQDAKALLAEGHF